MPLTTINQQKQTKQVKTGKARRWPDNAAFRVAGYDGAKLLHHWTDDENRAQTTDIYGLVTAKDLRAVKVDIEDWLQRGLIEKARVMVDAEPE